MVLRDDLSQEEINQLAEIDEFLHRDQNFRIIKC